MVRRIVLAVLTICFVTLLVLVGITALNLLRNPLRAPCLSNLKQISLGMRMYALDNGGRFLNAKDPTRALSLLYDRYINSRDVFSCPIKGRCHTQYDERLGFLVDIDYAYRPGLTEEDEKDTPIVCDEEDPDEMYRWRGNLAENSNHKGAGGNVLYVGGQAKWVSRADWKGEIYDDLGGAEADPPFYPQR